MSWLTRRMARVVCMLTAIGLAMTPVMAQTATAKIVSAANAFLGTLDDRQRQTVMFAFDDQKQRQRWSNFPTSFIPRGGISLKEMTLPQRAAALALVSSALSPRGFEKVEQIMEGDEVLKSSEGNGPRRGGNRPPFGNGGLPRRALMAVLPRNLGMAVRRHHAATGAETTKCLAKIFITSQFWESLPCEILGCCSLEVTIWR